MGLASVFLVTLKLVLISLRLENIALIDHLELVFNKGFTVFTGETGSGKSVLLEALNSLLANKQSFSSNKLISLEAPYSLIEGTFLISPKIISLLHKYEIDCDEDDFVITREWKLREGKYKSRSRVNGVVVNRDQILTLRNCLLDFTLQGDSFFFNNSSNQLLLLDRLGDENINKTILDVQAAWINWKKASEALINYDIEMHDMKIKLDKNKHMLEELELANLNNPHEDIHLKNEQDRLVNGVRLQEGINFILTRLNEGNIDMPSVSEHLNNCINELELITKLDLSLNKSLEQMFSLVIDMQDLINKLDAYNLSLESDPLLLDDLQNRLSLLKNLQIKYGLNIDELIQKRDFLKASILDNNIKNKYDQLLAAEKQLRQERDKKNLLLSTLRHQTSKKFESMVMKYLIQLGLQNVQFKVALNTVEATNSGIDQAEFLFSANPGYPVAPLSQIASGGEKSRVLLAIKTIFAAVDDSSTFIFDEIDSGVSGHVSSAIANLLKDLSRFRQVFCVTHQPLIAVEADHHFSVHKVVENRKTRSFIRPLNDFDEKKAELALLVGGDFSEAMNYAASLLEHKIA